MLPRALPPLRLELDFFAGSRSSIASSLRVIARSSLRSAVTSSCVAGRRSSSSPMALRDALAHLARLRLGALDELVERLARPVARVLGAADGRLDGPLDRLADRVGQLFGSRPPLGHSELAVFHIVDGVPGSPIHLRPAAELAERVLLPGDPHRALHVAQALLEKPLMFNHHRGLWGYSGTARDGEPLTIQSTGMGGAERGDRGRGADRAGRARR